MHIELVTMFMTTIVAPVIAGLIVHYCTLASQVNKTTTTINNINNSVNIHNHTENSKSGRK